MNPAFKLSIGADLVFFQIDHRACQRIGVVSFRPSFKVFALASPQLCFNVNCANRVQPDKPLCAGRLDADLRAALDPAARFFQQLHQRIESIRLHPKRSVNRHPQHVTLGCFGVLPKPLVISDRLVFRFPDDGKPMLLTNLIAQFSQRRAGTQDVSEFACAIQRSGTKDNMIMERGLSRVFFCWPLHSSSPRQPVIRARCAFVTSAHEYSRRYSPS